MDFRTLFAENQEKYFEKSCPISSPGYSKKTFVPIAAIEEYIRKILSKNHETTVEGLTLQGTFQNVLYIVYVHQK